MSKIGKKNISIPKDSSIKIEGSDLTITGPKGTKKLTINDKIFSSKLSESEFLFHASTAKKNSKIYAVGGRVLNFVSLSDNLRLARQNILENLKKLGWSGGFYRKDIGYKVIDK